MTPPDPNPPEDIPEDLSAALRDSDNSQLREIIHYAQQLLREQPSLTDAVESRPGEDLVRIEDHGAYTIVVVERPNETGEARGPFAYRIKWEPNIDEKGVDTNGTISDGSTVKRRVIAMAESFFDRLIVPVANRDDAASTAAVLVPYVGDSDCSVIAVHVIEKAGGAPDKASVEQLEERAEDNFATITAAFEATGTPLETDLRYGTDIAASIIGAAHDKNASAIAFTPRGGSRWRKLLTGDVTHRLVASSDIPILILPDQEVIEA